MKSGRKKRRRSNFRNRPPAEHHRELVSDPCAASTQLHVIAYGPSDIREMDSPDFITIDELRQQFQTVWLDVSGLADIDFIEKLCEHFAIHPLVREDIVRTHQRPKVEDYPNALFIVCRMAPHNGQEGTEQLALYLTGNCLLTFQEFPGDDFHAVRKRIRGALGRIRSDQADYLAYALVDAVIDAYFPIVDRYGEEIEQLEDELVRSPGKELLENIYGIRRQLLDLRRSLWPHREMMSILYRGDSALTSDATQVFFRDSYDHTVQLIDLTENYRELASNLMEVYLSSVSNRLNEIMKVLTMISVIFIPLTFVVGVYGMNFQPESSPWNMPETVAYYGYPICLGVMLLIAVGQLAIFWRKGWLTSRNK